jgi:acyl-coenzyme A synthetase/AMP-(fatty) acid ligase
VVFDELKGQIPLALVVTKLGSEMEHYQLEQEIIKLVRKQMGGSFVTWLSFIDYLRPDQVKHCAN